MRNLVLSVVLMAAFVSQAANVEVSGSWAGKVSDGDDVIVTGDASIDKDYAINSLTFRNDNSAATMTLSGDFGLTITSAITVGVAADDKTGTDVPAEYACTLGVPVTAAGTLALNVYGSSLPDKSALSPKVTLNVDEAFDFGAYGLTRAGGGRLNFKKDVFGTGAVTLSKGATYLSGPHCGLGGWDSAITVTSVYAPLYLDGTVLSNKQVRTTYKSSGTPSSIHNTVNAYPVGTTAATVNRVVGEIFADNAGVNNIGIYSAQNATLSLEGGVRATSATVNVCPAYWGMNYAHNEYTTYVITNTAWTVYNFALGDFSYAFRHVIFAVPGMNVKNAIGWQKNVTYGADYEFAVDWVFNATDESLNCAPLRARDKSGTYNACGKIDLRGTKQRFGGFSPSSVSSDGMTGTLTGTAGSVFYCRQWMQAMDASPLAAKITGALSFVKEGTNSLTLVGTANDTTGALKVHEGRLTLKAAARFTALSSLVVGAAPNDTETIVTDATATPKLVVNAAANLNQVPLYLNGDGVVEVADGVIATVDRIYIDGEEMPAGGYSATTCPSDVPAAQREAVMAHFAGAGDVNAVNGKHIVVEETTWTGAGSDGKWSDPDNWSNGQPQNGYTVTIAGDTVLTSENDIDGLVLRGLVLTGAGNKEITGKAFQLGAQGLTVGTSDSDTATVTNVIRSKITFTDSQTWQVLGANSRLEIYGGFDSGDGFALVRTGKGELHLYGVSSGDGAVQLLGDAGKTYAHNTTNALGDAGSTLTIENGAWLYLDNAELWNGSVVMKGAYGLATVADTKDNFVRGQLVPTYVSNPTKGTGATQIINAKGAVLALDGGIDGGTTKTICNSLTSGSGGYVNRDVGTLVMTNAPFAVADFADYTDQVGLGTVILGAPGSTVAGDIFWTSCSLTFTADWTLGNAGGIPATAAGLGCISPRYASSTKTYQDVGGTMDFRGTKQRIGGFVLSFASGSLIGTAGSEFHCYQNTETDFQTHGVVAVGSQFKGALSFYKEGPQPLALSGTSPTTGSLNVEQGRLYLMSDASWPNCPAVSVADGATLTVSNAVTFARRRVDMTVAEGGVVDLPFDGVIRLKSLTLGDNVVSGDWGAVGSGAEHETEAITGTGILRAGGRGFVLMVK